MDIRKLQVEDAEAYWKLRLQALYEYPRSFGASYEEVKDKPIERIIERFSASDSNFILGAFSEPEELIGMAGFRRETFLKMRHKGTVWGMYVDRAYQGRGIGQRLMQELLHRVRKIPELEQIQLYVVDTNEHAKRLYQSVGFTTYGLEIHAMKLDDSTYVNEEFMVYRWER